MPVQAPNFGQDPWSLETPTEPGKYWLRAGDMRATVEVSQGPKGLLVVFVNDHNPTPRPIEEVAQPHTEWSPV